MKKHRQIMMPEPEYNYRNIVLPVDIRMSSYASLLIVSSDIIMRRFEGLMGLKRKM